MRNVREGPVPALGVLLLGAPTVLAQAPSPCRVLCAPEFKVEPTITFSNIFVREDGTVSRERRETDFEVILSLGLPTRVSCGTRFPIHPPFPRTLGAIAAILQDA